jgi:hypothetical protein
VTDLLVLLVLRNPCGAKVIDANLLPDKTLSLSVTGGPGHGLDGDKNYSVDALCHFTIQVDNGPFWRFLGDPIFYNGHSCNHEDNSFRNNPFKYTWNYDFETPPGGTWFDIWISVYWSCETARRAGGSRTCSSEDLHYRTYVK